MADEDEKGQKDQASTSDAKKEDQWIPKVRFDEATNKLEADNRRLAEELAREREERAKLSGQFEAFSKQPSQNQSQPRYTRAQLAQYVEAGQITQAQADDLIDQQNQRDMRELVDKSVQTAVSQFGQRNLVDTHLGQYRELVPEAWQTGTEQRNRIQQEYSFLIQAGYPAGPQTELVATRSVLGPVERLRKELPDRRETLKGGESGGESGSEKGGNSDEPEVLKSLNNREKAYYKRKIEDGIYKDWNAVAEERKFVRPRTR